MSNKYYGPKNPCVSVTPVTYDLIKKIAQRNKVPLGAVIDHMLNEEGKK